MASQLIEEVTAHAQSDGPEDEREIFAQTVLTFLITYVLRHNPNTFIATTARNSTFTPIKETTGIRFYHRYGIPYSLFMTEVKVNLAWIQDFATKKALNSKLTLP